VKRDPLPFAAILLACLLSSCNFCQNEISTEVFSSDNVWKFVTFNRSCGATSSDSFQLSILNAHSKLDGRSANAFIADNNHGATTFVAEAHWISDRAIQVTYSSKARVFKAEPSVNGINIQYIKR
jgi:hypothetical protein